MHFNMLAVESFVSNNNNNLNKIKYIYFIIYKILKHEYYQSSINNVILKNILYISIILIFILI